MAAIKRGLVQGRTWGQALRGDHLSETDSKEKKRRQKI